MAAGIATADCLSMRTSNADTTFKEHWRLRDVNARNGVQKYRLKNVLPAWLPTDSRQPNNR